MQDTTQITDNEKTEEYLVLEREIKDYLIKYLERGKMTVKEVAEVCFVLGHAKTAKGLQFLIDELRKDFDVLEEMEDVKEGKEDVALDQIVQKYVSHLIQVDPMKAGLVGARASEEGVTLENLLVEFPDLEEYV